MDTSNFSSQDRTLANVKEDLLSEKSGKALKAMRMKREQKASQRGVPMREEFFSKKGWARFFISGPADPLHNLYMVWCHICKKNIPIPEKGVDEMLRHHCTKKHLRKDQRWRYEHLKRINPFTKVELPQVRDKFAVLSKGSALQVELPLFIGEELVDIGPKSHLF